MASPTRWAWVWVNSGSWWWTGRPGVLRFMGSQRVRHDWATELNWTEYSFISYYTTPRCSVCMCSFSLLCPGEELLIHKVCEYSLFQDNASSLSHRQCSREPLHLPSAVSAFLCLAVVVLICISLVVNEVDYLFGCWLSTCIFSCEVLVYCPRSIELFVFLLRFLYVLCSNPLLAKYVKQISFLIRWLVFSLIKKGFFFFFGKWKCFVWMWSMFPVKFYDSLCLA